MYLTLEFELSIKLFQEITLGLEHKAALNWFSNPPNLVWLIREAPQTVELVFLGPLTLGTLGVIWIETLSVVKVSPALRMEL